MAISKGMTVKGQVFFAYKRGQISLLYNLIFLIYYFEHLITCCFGYLPLDLSDLTVEGAPLE